MIMNDPQICQTVAIREGYGGRAGTKEEGCVQGDEVLAQTRCGDAVTSTVLLLWRHGKDRCPSAWPGPHARRVCVFSSSVSSVLTHRQTILEKNCAKFRLCRVSSFGLGQTAP